MDKKELKERLNNIAKELQVIFKIIEESEPAFPAAKLIDVENKKCLECGLQIEGRIVRGLHESCRKSLKKRLLEKGLSEAYAINQGWILPPDAGGSPPKSSASLIYLQAHVNNLNAKTTPKRKRGG